MRVRVLGGLSVDDISERDLGSRKARTLLKVLALARGAPVPADRLADVLWGDDPPARPADQIGVLVSRLRAVLGGNRLIRTDAGYSLAVEWLDADELVARTREAADALAAGRIGAARSAAKSALVLARGTVLPEEEGEWVDVDRANCAAIVGSARRIAAEAASRAGDHFAAVAAAEDALAHDPYDEAALRILMRAHVAAGRPASALGSYVRVRDRIVEDLGVSPTAETEALHDAIVVGEERPPVSEATVTPLPGRDGELAALEAALDLAAASARPVAVAIVGEAGIGKTVLMEHWCRWIENRAYVLVGRCDALGRDLPLQPIADAVATNLAMLDHESRASALAPHAGVLGPLFGGHSRTATVISDPELDRASLFTTLLTLIAQLADQRVVVLVVDDLHLTGESTLAWLRFAIRRGRRLLIVTASRLAGLPIEDARLIELGPLDFEATAAIVGQERAVSLYQRSGGHPLLLTALAESDDEALPTSVHEAVARRLESLGDAAATVRTAAVLGRDIDLDLLAGALQLPAIELLSHLERAAAGGLLVERSSGFAFRHEMERESLALAAGAPRRALLHRAAAATLATRQAPDPLVVATHARLGGDMGLAIDWFTRAAEVAMARHDVKAAAAHLDAALALGDSPVALVTRARLRMATGQLEEAAEDAAGAVAGGAGAVALEVSGWVAYYRRRYEVALGFTAAALERAIDPALRVSCLALAGRVHHGAGRLPEAVEHLETAVSVEARPDVRALAGVWLAQVRVHQGRPTEAVALLDRALADPDRLAHPFAPLHGRFARVLALGQLARVNDALRACDELDTDIGRRGEVGARMAAPAANARAWILRWTQRTQEADDLNYMAVESTDPAGVRAEAYYSGLLDLADGCLLAGDDGGAGALLERLAPIEGWSGTMAWHQRHRWLLLRGRLALRDGDFDRCAELSAAVAADAAARGARRYQLLAAALEILAGGDDDDVGTVVAGLQTCAALDGASLVDALTARAR